MEFFQDFIAPIILLFCLCIGYIIKNLIPDERINRFIPLIMGAVGTAAACIHAGSLSLPTVLSGLVSGLASTGMYEAFHQLINKQ